MQDVVAGGGVHAADGLSLDVEKNVPMLGVDSFRDVTPINLPNLETVLN